MTFIVLDLSRLALTMSARHFSSMIFVILCTGTRFIRMTIISSACLHIYPFVCVILTQAIDSLLKMTPSRLPLEFVLQMVGVAIRKLQMTSKYVCITRACSW